MALKGLLASWLAAAISLPLVLLTAAVGQGLGSVLAGGSWIGISVPWDRQAWALINQPVLNFAALPSASGYWLGSLAAPLLVAVLGIALSLRLRTLATQLFVVQWSWMATVIGLAWQPSLEPHLSHLTRWLQFRDLPTELRWITVGLAVMAAVPIVLRLIAITRITRYHLGRVRRLALVASHLLPAPIVWATTSTILKGVVPVEACVLAGIPLFTVVAVAWIGYPMPLTHPVAPIKTGVIAQLIVIMVVVWAAIWTAGRPLPDDRAAAVQWAREGSTNNIRGWMEPLRAPWLQEGTVNDGNPG